MHYSDSYMQHCLLIVGLVSMCRTVTYNFGSVALGGVTPGYAQAACTSIQTWLLQ